jgi:hypothetical protein
LLLPLLLAASFTGIETENHKWKGLIIMTKNNHPITPPPELVEQWRNLPEYVSQLRTMSTVTITTEKLQHIATQAARWGSDQELEACCQALYARYDIPNCIFPKMAEDMREWLRAARRPKPPSLKEQALIELGDVYNRNKIDDVTYDTIRLALEQLND